MVSNWKYKISPETLKKLEMWEKRWAEMRQELYKLSALKNPTSEQLVRKEEIRNYIREPFRD